MTEDLTDALRGLAATMREVADDCADDATKVDSTPFTPRGVGESFGTALAMLGAVAKGVAIVADSVAVIDMRLKKEGL